MELWALGLIVGLIIAATAAFIWLALLLKSHGSSNPGQPVSEQAAKQLFSPDFISELHDKIRAEFSVAINKHADDARLELEKAIVTLHQQIAEQLQNSVRHEFTQFEHSITNAKELLTSTATKGQEALEQQQKTILQSYEHDLDVQKNHRLTQFEEKMTDIVSQYVLSAVGSETEGKDQLAQILRELDNHKSQIIEDMRRD